MLGLPILALAA